MQIQHTPAPFPSTILSLQPSEQFSYKGTTIQAVTLDPTNPALPYTLSGESNGPRVYADLPTLPTITPELVRAAAARELALYATPVPRTAPDTTLGRLGYAPGDTCTVSAAGIPGPAHLQAVPSLPAHPQPHTPRKGAHRA